MVTIITGIIQTEGRRKMDKWEELVWWLESHIETEKAHRKMYKGTQTSGKETGLLLEVL